MNALAELETITVDGGLADISEHPAIDYLREVFEEIEDNVSKYSLADAIREGSSVTEGTVGWFDMNGGVCAMTAAYVAARARGLT
jgi:hypothetical protein